MSAARIDSPGSWDGSSVGTTAQLSTAIRTLEGKWSMRDWRHGHENADKENTETSDAEIFSEKNGIHRGRFSNKQGEYILSGYLKTNSVFTGTWERDLQGAGGIWHGAFQFKVIDHADRMLGLWVGISKNETHMNWGIWEWKRHGVEGYPSEFEEHLSLLPSPRSFRLGWNYLPKSSKIAIIAAAIPAIITALGVVVAAIVRILPELIK
jgi:hypothetical protein